ncbi:hypothetical protein BB559_003589 [Furculomyces boomerangus]|uniref:Pterin-binding domain-containing protein n=1 Tax=Furculomyces boomerangus TaxID=61424 RepID=A0A2T9YKE5_9FUNG|nr:hypothetical protein BB559_003589 [Furculomyces boomerangus]
MDTIGVYDLEIRGRIGKDYWEREKVQPILVTFRVQTSTFKSGQLDNVTDSIHYAKIAKKIVKFVETQNLESLDSLAEHICYLCLTYDIQKAYGVFVTVKQPRTLLSAKLVKIDMYRCRTDLEGMQERCKEMIETTGFDIVDLSLFDDKKIETYFPDKLTALEQSIKDSGELYHEDFVTVNDLQINVLLGVNLWERYSKQSINVDITIHMDKSKTKNQKIHRDSSENVQQEDIFIPSRDLRRLVERVSRYVEEGTRYLTLEALTTAIARVAILECHVEKVSVHIKKPLAIMFAQCSAVRITRTKTQLLEALDINSVLPQQHQLPSISGSESNSESTGLVMENIKKLEISVPHVVYVAVGTNIGDRLRNIHQALRKINEIESCRVCDTGFLYETKAMYVVDQPGFLNTAFKVETKKTPHELLVELKKIESDMGRDFNAQRFGPRVIDLDILFYDSLVLESEDLVIPHPRCHERHFQLQPVIDMNPYVLHNKLTTTVDTLSKKLVTIDGVPNDVVQVMPLSNSEISGKLVIVPVGENKKETIAMGIVNTTPDSFSDGGMLDDSETAADYAVKLFDQGAQIIDIGGQSTKPGAESVSISEEISRVAPVIANIRNRQNGNKYLISVDTFVAKVAREALDAGADIINDVSGGDADPEMFKLAAEKGCPIVIMHMRGTPKTMNSLTDYGSAGDMGSGKGDVVLGIRFELAKKVRAALNAGIPRFNIILDPGIGFAKTHEQNFEILRRLSELTGEPLYSVNSKSTINFRSPKLSPNLGSLTGSTEMSSQYHEKLAASLVGYPVLIGCSRKRFIGLATGKENPKDRVYGTAATVTSAIQGNAAIVRIHDVESLVDVIKVSDSIYKPNVQEK